MVPSAAAWQGAAAAAKLVVSWPRPQERQRWPAVVTRAAAKGSRGGRGGAAPGSALASGSSSGAAACLAPRGAALCSGAGEAEEMVTLYLSHSPVLPGALPGAAARGRLAAGPRLRRLALPGLGDAVSRGAPLLLGPRLGCLAILPGLFPHHGEQRNREAPCTSGGWGSGLAGHPLSPGGGGGAPAPPTLPWPPSAAGRGKRRWNFLRKTSQAPRGRPPFNGTA